MSNILLSGAGQVGAQMIRILHEEYGIKPVVIDVHFHQDYLDSVVDSSWYVPIQGSILDKDLVSTTLQEYKIDRISHSAAVLPMRVGHDPHPGFFEVNTWGSANMMFLAVAHQVQRFVMFSTNGVYQFRNFPVQEPVAEDFPSGLSIHNSYGSSKATAENLLKELTLAGKIQGNILRPGEIYGPVMGRAGDDTIYWKSMFDAAIEGMPFALENHPEHRLDWVYCKDVARLACTVLMAESTPHIDYNLSFGQCMGIYDIKEALDELYPQNQVSLKDCQKGGWNYPLSMQRAKSDFGFVPAYNLHQGILDYANWYGALKH